MLAFTTTMKDIIFDEASLLKNYSLEQLERIMTVVSRRYNVWVLTNMPHPRNPTRNVISSLHVQSIDPMVTVYVTQDFTQIKYAQQRNLSTILLTEQVSDVFTVETIYIMPDLVLSMTRFEGFMMHDVAFGYRSEIAVENNLRSTGNGVLQNPKGLLYAAGVMQHKLDRNIQADLIIPGRFFTTGDTRAYSDVLTHYILCLKDQRSFAVKVFSESIRVCLDLMEEKKVFDMITAVPSRDSFNKLHPIFEQNILVPYKSRFNLDLLFVKESYAPQKKAGHGYNRARNIQNKIGVSYNVRGHVLLVDDIFTTGATTLECARMLYLAGAESVTILPLAITQHKVKTTIRKPIKDEVGRPYQLKLLMESGEPYWKSSKDSAKPYQEIRRRYFEE